MPQGAVRAGGHPAPSAAPASEQAVAALDLGVLQEGIETSVASSLLCSGTTEAAKRRAGALQLERGWGNARCAHALSVRQGQTILRRGKFKLN